MYQPMFVHKGKRHITLVWRLKTHTAATDVLFMSQTELA